MNATGSGSGSSSSNGQAAAAASASAQAAVFVQSQPLPAGTPTIHGPDFEHQNPNELLALLQSMSTVGFQATGVSKAIEIVDEMRSWRLAHDPAYLASDDPDKVPLSEARDVGCKILLGFTSNLVSSGLREVIKFLVKNKMVSALVTTAGGIEEDLIKCLGPTFLGDFSLDGATLRKQGLNRIGNLLVPNDNYCKFEDWVMPILNAMREEQGDDVANAWSPSRVIERLGREINDESSILYWAAKHEIPVFCPALTDGSLGDMLYFHSYKNPGLTIDLVKDIRRLNDLSVKAPKAGMIILGGGVCKHQIANAMLFRNGADFSVYINTGQEFDGSDSGARPDEAVSWGKIKSAANGGKNVKVYCDATIIFPLIVAATFGRAHWEQKSRKA
ncbi:putative deoxyhypusine synthase [Testicularia cyperi]|uniref:deoxyhypusine synthase n=1 Tax=Testicularia cyperi TaxID=1882483 RepID=A0A317XPD1_9BASI|nr:putative deoxyhypusine synthase [Testicularia cyperi]